MGDFWEVFGEDLGTKVIDRDCVKIKLYKKICKPKSILQTISARLLVPLVQPERHKSSRYVRTENGRKENPMLIMQR